MFSVDCLAESCGYTWCMINEIPYLLLHKNETKKESFGWTFSSVSCNQDS